MRIVIDAQGQTDYEDTDHTVFLTLSTDKEGWLLGIQIDIDQPEVGITDIEVVRQLYLATRAVLADLHYPL